MSNKETSEIETFTSNPKRKFNLKGFLIGLAVSFVALSIIGIVVGVISVNGKGYAFGSDTAKILCDSFFVSGALGLCFWLLLFVSREGGFDLLVYGCKKLFLYTFTSKAHAKASMPESYVEYVELKREKRSSLFVSLLIISSIYFIISLILLIFTR